MCIKLHLPRFYVHSVEKSGAGNVMWGKQEPVPSIKSDQVGRRCWSQDALLPPWACTQL